jgi:hypothetical protein
LKGPGRLVNPRNNRLDERLSSQPEATPMSLILSLLLLSGAAVPPDRHVSRKVADAVAEGRGWTLAGRQAGAAELAAIDLVAGRPSAGPTAYRNIRCYQAPERLCSFDHRGDDGHWRARMLRTDADAPGR